MRKDNIIGGIVLICIGIFIFLAEFGIIAYSSLSIVLQLWPLFLIAFGISIIFKKNSVISGIAWLLVFGILIGYGVFYHETSSGANYQGKVISKPSGLETADLNLKLGGLSFELRGTHQELFIGNFDKELFTLDTVFRNNHGILNFRNKTRKFNFLDRNNYNCSIDVSQSIVWNIKAEVGAISGKIDLSQLMVDRFELKMGAGNVDILFGEKHSLTNALIESGASKIDIYLSENLGAKIKIKGAMKSTNLNNLGWTKENDYYVSPGFNEADSKLILEVNAGMASINIKR